MACILILIAGFLVPPLVSLGRYKSRITQLMSASFGRPVRLSSVELRLLPWPGFVLTDVSVAEDPAYGAEPVLHANTVTANIRLLSLWRGRLEISSVSVDEASLNVVRAGPGRWNLDPLFRTAAAHSGSPFHSTSLPYLEATNSRINFKNGAEKLPFSLMNTDLSFWQEGPNQWRIRLRGQPARTDVSLDLADTGIVRMEASLGRAPALHLIPVHADIDWRAAQLGQLSRLLIGSDKGWRGDLTGELHLDGTPDTAHITTRLRATNVHRAEFAPSSPLDFDANCNFVYHYGRRALDNLVCNSPLGDGRLQVTGDLPGSDGAANLTAELDRIPVGAGLDLLRTMRSGIEPSLEAAGTISGRLIYDQDASGEGRPTHSSAHRQGPLSGALTVEGFALSGGSLDAPLAAPKFVLQPASAQARDGQAGVTLAGTLSLPAGGGEPLDVGLRLAMGGYEADIHGAASLARARAIEDTAGITGGAVLDGVTGEPLTVNLRAAGPWLLPEEGAAPEPAAPDTDGALPQADRLAGTVTLHDVNWRADFLASRVHVAQATLHVGGDELRWDPVDFSYGPVKGQASLTLPQNCAAQADASSECVPQFELEMGSLKAETIQAAFLGAHRNGTLLSDLLNRLHPTVPPPWPQMNGTVKAEALELGPVTLRKISMAVKIAGNRAEFSDMQALLLGGQVKARGVIRWADGDRRRPSYSITAEGKGLSAAAVGHMLNAHWAGGPLDASGSVDLSGFTLKELAGSATGNLHFDWRKGTLYGPGRAAAASAKAARAAAPIHFGRWSGEARIGGNDVRLGPNRMTSASGKSSLEGEVRFGTPPKVEWSRAQSTR